MSKKITSLLYGFVFMGAMAGSASAAIVSVEGDINIISAPVSVIAGQLENSTTTYAFDEKQGYVLTENLAVDRLTSTGSSGLISAATRINSYFVHMDLVGDETAPETVITFDGTLTFDAQILGLIWTGVPCTAIGCPPSVMNLDASDYLGNPVTTYSTGESGRGYEVDDYYAFNGSQDFISLSPDGYSVTFSASSHPLRSDQLRIITASPVPVPLSIWLFGSGLVALAGMGIKRRA